MLASPRPRPQLLVALFRCHDPAESTHARAESRTSLNRGSHPSHKSTESPKPRGLRPAPPRQSLCPTRSHAAAHGMLGGWVGVDLGTAGLCDQHCPVRPAGATSTALCDQQVRPALPCATSRCDQPACATTVRLVAPAPVRPALRLPAIPRVPRPPRPRHKIALHPRWGQGHILQEKHVMDIPLPRQGPSESQHALRPQHTAITPPRIPSISLESPA